MLCEQVLAEARQGIEEDYPASSGQFKRLLAALQYELVTDPSPKQVSQHATLLPDPKDVPIALAVINAKVDYFVSEDKHFTVRSEQTEQFHQKVRVRIAGTFVREVIGWTGEELDEAKKRI